MSEPGGAVLASPTDTSWASEDATGLSDNQPVLAQGGGQATFEPGAWDEPRTFCAGTVSSRQRRERSFGNVPACANCLALTIAESLSACHQSRRKHTPCQPN